jgi:EAL domain-containing protein (putative c-di-GMP-specific phosphodiesterase class I)/GGDEF domain-containing protein
MNNSSSISLFVVRVSLTILVLTWVVALATVALPLRSYLHGQLRQQGQAIGQALAAELAADPQFDLAKLPQQVQVRAAQESWSDYELQTAEGVSLASSAVAVQVPLFSHLLRGEVPVVWTPIQQQGQTVAKLGVAAPALAADQLSEEIVLGFAVVSLVSSLLLGSILRVVWRTASQPLVAMESQVRELAERRFVELREPGILDWLPLARALNVLVVRVRSMLRDSDQAVDQYRQRLAYDPLTKAASRDVFVDALKVALQGEGGGALLLLHANDIDGMNLRLGRRRTDDFLLALATALRSRLLLEVPDNNFLLARLNGADFAVLLPGRPADTVDALSAKLQQAVAALAADGLTDLATPAHLVVSPFLPADSASEVLSRANSLLGAAIALQRPYLTDNTPARHHKYGVAEWRALIERALDEGRIGLVFNSVCDQHGNVVHTEAQALLLEGDGQVLQPDVLLLAAVRCGRIVDIDVRAVDLALRQLGERNGFIAVTVAAQSLQHPIYLRHVRDLLRSAGDLASRLILEVPVGDLHGVGLRSLADLRAAIQPHGCRLALKAWDDQARLLGLMSGADVAYVKVARQLTVGIALDAARRQLLAWLIELGQRVDFAVLAATANSAEDEAALWQLGVAGIGSRSLPTPEAVRVAVG